VPIMDRHSLGTIAHFCTYQQVTFDARAWLSQCAADPKAYAVAAKYLSMTSWYGHDEELERVATRLCPALAVPEGFDRELRSIGFDLPYFSSSLRYRIALRGIGKTVKDGYAVPSTAQAQTDASEGLHT
jgi:hypothetical protein